MEQVTIATLKSRGDHISLHAIKMIKELQEIAINFTDSSSQLKEKETPTFEFWLDAKGYELDEYKFYKDQKGSLYFKIDLENMYKKEFNL